METYLISILQSLQAVEVWTATILIVVATIAIISLKFFSKKTGIVVENEVEVFEEVRDQNVKQMKEYFIENYRKEVIARQKKLPADQAASESVTNEIDKKEDIQNNDEDKEDETK